VRNPAHAIRPPCLCQAYLQFSQKDIRYIGHSTGIPSFNDLEKVVHASLSSRLDYSNSLHTGISMGQLVQQLVQTRRCQAPDGYREERPALFWPPSTRSQCGSQLISSQSSEWTRPLLNLGPLKPLVHLQIPQVLGLGSGLLAVPRLKLSKLQG